MDDDYDIDSVIGAPSYGDEPTPSFANSFTDGLAPQTLGAGEIQGNTTVTDGYLQSENYVAATSGWRLTPTTAELNVSTAIHSLDIPDTTTASSFHVDTAGNTWWGANVATGLAGANASVTAAGAAVFKSVTLSGNVAISGIANNTSTDISLLGTTFTMTFSVTSATVIAWTSGTVTLSNGRTFSISSGNTGTMAALTYIYVDPAVSSTVLQTTTTASTATGANKVLIGMAKNNTVTASFIPFNGGQPLIDGGNIGALSIVSANIAASTITAAKLTVSQLSSITADLGAMTAGSIVLPSGGFIRSGMTAYLTGTGFYIGNDSGTPRFSFGNSSGNYIAWDGTTLTIVGNQVDIQVFTASGTWTKPTGAQSVDVTIIGGGGGGGSGANNNTAGFGGGSGGGGGGYSRSSYPASVLSATHTITIGTGGSGGVSVNTVGGPGNGGNAGNDSTFGTKLLAGGGGGGGRGDQNVNNVGGTAGTGMFPGGVGGAGNASAPSTTFGAGGGGGGGAQNNTTGGAGGTITNIPRTGGAGGTSSGNGTAGTSATTNEATGGSGGGGGGGSNTGIAGNGALGGNYGSGGGAGGGTTANFATGGGAAGKDGICVVITYK